MGTKRDLARTVAGIIDSARSGPVLDVFSGMCSVGEALAGHRQIWTNDIQVFAYEVATALFTSTDELLKPVRMADIHFDEYNKHLSHITQQLSGSIDAEEALFASRDFKSFEKNYMVLRDTLKIEIGRLSNGSFTLFTRLYADTFFGVRQAIQIDSILASLCRSLEGRQISNQQKRWANIGLGRAMLRIANSTGHFAQFLKPKVQSYLVFIRQRKRDVWSEWLMAADEMSPAGDLHWRKGNRVFNEDSLKLIPTLKDMTDCPSVIYADPPYTDDQYSRYYHVLETLILYDYPTISGAGLYRTGRFKTPFSLKSQVIDAMENLISSVAECGADIVLSYPTNGLIYEAGGDPEMILRRYFRSVERLYASPHSHSTFGASKGPAKSVAIEQIYMART